MPVLDATRVAFVRNEYRYETASDAAVLATYPSATVVEINTQLSAASAATLAANILAATKTHAITLEVEIDGVVMLEDFDGTVNQYTVNLPNLIADSRTYRLVSSRSDFVKDITTLRLRG